MQCMGWLGVFLNRVKTDLVKEMLGPDDAVYGLAGRVPNGAAGEGLLVGLGLTLVALGHSLHSFTTGKLLYSIINQYIKQ
jgi:hypothetical protein